MNKNYLIFNASLNKRIVQMKLQAEKLSVIENYKVS